jgi:DNA-binding NtrC family response regulator
MVGVDDLVARAANTRINGLIHGELGVGKKELARTIHRMSPRAGGPFLILDCTAPTETILTELLGRESDGPGLLEKAKGGDLLLAEVGELDIATQSKLMRVVETRQVVRQGGHEANIVDLRFIASTSRNLESQARAGKFRLDLFYRLTGFILEIKPLRQRVSEIPGLAQHFVARACEQSGRLPPALSPAVVGLLERHAWPENIRELKLVIEEALLRCGGLEVLPEHLRPGWWGPAQV